MTPRLTASPSLPDSLLTVQRSLEQAGVSDSRLEAELLLCHVLGMNRAHLYTQFTIPGSKLSAVQAQALMSLVERRSRREPLAYILGSRWFYGLEFIVRPGVLVPRPETELLVQRAIALAGDQPLVIADVGTGCGNIAVTLALHLPRARILATDVSSIALEVARENATRHGVTDRVLFLHGDLLAPVPRGGLDMIVANLPYVRHDALTTAQPELHYEPVEALDGGSDGLEVIRRLVAQARGCVPAGGRLLLEMDPWQIEGASTAVRASFPRARLWAERDLSGRERMLVAQV